MVCVMIDDLVNSKYFPLLDSWTFRESSGSGVNIEAFKCTDCCH